MRSSSSPLKFSRMTFPTAGHSFERDDFAVWSRPIIGPASEGRYLKRASWQGKETHEVGRWSNRGGQRCCCRWRRCPQQTECEGGPLALDSRDGCSHERRIRCSQRTEGRRNPPLARRSTSGQALLGLTLRSAPGVAEHCYTLASQDRPPAIMTGARRSFRNAGRGKGRGARPLSWAYLLTSPAGC